MKYITQLIQRIKDVINTWIDKRVLNIKINKFNITDNDVVFIKVNSQFTSLHEINNLKDTLDDIDSVKGKYILIYNGFVNDINTLNLGEKDVVVTKIPLETFYLWDRSGELKEKSSIIKEQFKDSGIDNKLVVLPDGYEYKQEDYATILNKINQTDVRSETVR